MSILGDDDEGRQYINIFDQGELSVESRPFEESNPIQLAVGEPASEPEVPTDTPEQPAEPPAIGEVEEFVSMEEPEDLSVSLENLDLLVTTHDRISRTGTITRDDVFQVERMYPGTIPNGSVLGRFSSMPSPVNAVPSMEGIGATILDKIKSIIDYILERLSRLTGFVLKKKEKLADGIDGEWATFLGNVSKVAGRDGLQLLRERFPKDPLVNKSSSLDHYFRMYADLVYLRLDNRWKTAYNSIQLNTDLPREMGKLSADLNQSVEKVRANIDAVRSKRYDVTSIPMSSGSIDDERGALRNRYSKREFMRVKVFATAIKYPRTDINKVNETFTTLDRIIKDASTQAKSLRASITDKDSVAALGAVKSLNEQVAQLNRTYSILDIYVNFYIQYISELSSVINVCNTRLTSLGGLKR